MNANYMNSFRQRYLLPISVFITGACVLVIEIVAVRALSPHFGSTIFTVSSVISVILAALSVGYYVGGKWADTHPSQQWFFGIILVSSLVVLLIHFLSILILPLLSLTLSLAVGPLVASFVLFFVPAFLLGMLSPYAITLQTLLVPEEGIGSVTGQMFFWSTLGSIIGSLLAGFVLIPFLGIDMIFIGTGVVLFLLGLVPLLLLGLDRGRLVKSVLVFVVLVGLSTMMIHQIEGAALYTHDGVYEKLTIYDTTDLEGRPIRLFQQDKSASGAMFLDTDDPTDLVFDYTKYYRLYTLLKPDVATALVIGGGVYSVPKALQAELPEATIIVSEIEPSLYELAQTYFAVTPNDKLVNSTLDGRRLLREHEGSLDLIFSDVYYSLYSVPSHFTTKEFFTLAKEKLAPEGVFIANLIGDLTRQEPSLIFSEIKTFQNVFENSYVFAVDSPTQRDPQNIMLVGHNSETSFDFQSSVVTEHGDPFIRTLGDKLVDLERFELSPYQIMTDNHAPVDWLTAQVVRHSDDEASVSGDELLATVAQQLRYGPRYVGSEGHQAVQDFIVAEMSARADQTIEQTWEHVGSDGATYELTNLIGRFYPEREHRVILGTHYDSKRLADRDRRQSNAPVPGANDSASGVAVLMGVAAALNESVLPPDVGVDLVFFDAEEGEPTQGSDYTDWKPLGSTYFTERIDELYPNVRPQSAVVVDMVCDKHLQILKEPSSVESAATEVDAFWSVARDIDDRVFKNELGPRIRDDHTPLNAIGIPSLLVIDFTYPPFHTTRDTLDKCGGNSLELITQAVLAYLYQRS